MMHFQQKRVILDVAILIRRLLKEQGLSKSDLAGRLGRSKAFITQLLDGRANMTLRTISDVLCVLGHSLTVSPAVLEIEAKGPPIFTIKWEEDHAKGGDSIAPAPTRTQGPNAGPPLMKLPTGLAG